MNRETIEKEINARLDEPDNQWDGIFNSGYSRGFKDGSQWRINAVWHEANDKPEFCDKKGIWIVMYFGHGMLSTTFARNDEWDELRKRNNFAKWAYQADLMPDRKEASL